MNRMIALLLILLAHGAPASGGTQASSAPPRSDSAIAGTRCTLTIRTDVDSAVVLLDSLPRGRTPLHLAGIAPGSHVVKILHPNQADWYGYPVMDTLDLGPGEERTLRYKLPHWYMVVSIPSGGQVFEGDSLLGATPLLLRSDPRMEGASLSVQKPGFEPATSFETEGHAVLKFTLRQLWRPDLQGNGVPEVSLEDVSTSPSPRFYIAGAATLLSGAAAAYFKIKADDRHDLYLLNGNPALAAETHRLDNAAAACLVISEIGFAFMTWYLLSD